MSRASQRNAWLIQHCFSPYGTTQLEKTGKKGSFGPRKAPFGALEVLGGPGEADLIPTTPHWPAWVGFMVTTHFDLVSGLFWAHRGPKRARFGPKCPFWGPRRAPGDQIWSQLPRIDPPGLDSWSAHTLTWYRAPSGSSGGQK